MFAELDIKTQTRKHRVQTIMLCLITMNLGAVIEQFMKKRTQRNTGSSELCNRILRKGGAGGGSRFGLRHSWEIIGGLQRPFSEGHLLKRGSFWSVRQNRKVKSKTYLVRVLNNLYLYIVPFNIAIATQRVNDVQKLRRSNTGRCFHAPLLKH